MGWANLDALLGCSLHPSAKDAAAGKDESMRFAAIEHG